MKIDKIQFEACKKAGVYLKLKKRKKEIKRNLITGIILLSAFTMLIIFY